MNVKAYISTKRQLLLVLDLQAQFALCEFQLVLFDRYLRMKKQEIIQVNVNAHVLLLFSICYTDHSQI